MIFQMRSKCVPIPANPIRMRSKHGRYVPNAFQHVPKTFQTRSKRVPNAFQTRSKGVQKASKRHSERAPNAFQMRSKGVPKCVPNTLQRPHNVTVRQSPNTGNPISSVSLAGIWMLMGPVLVTQKERPTRANTWEFVLFWVAAVFRVHQNLRHDLSPT